MKNTLIKSILLLLSVIGLSSLKFNSFAQCEKAYSYLGAAYNPNSNEFSINLISNINKNIYLSFSFGSSLSKKDIKINESNQNNLLPYMGYELTDMKKSSIITKIGIGYPVHEKLLLNASLGIQRNTIISTYVWGESKLNYNTAYQYNNILVYEISSYYRANFGAIGLGYGNNGIRFSFLLPINL